MNAKQLKELVIIPTLDFIGLNSESAVNLLLGTCAQESKMGEFIKQNSGPALGIYQMEPETHHNLIIYLHGKVELNKKITELVSAKNLYSDRNEELIFNLRYATAMARVRYLAWNPDPLPDANNVPALAKYWKKNYNTPEGAGKEPDFVINYHTYVIGKV